MNIGMTTFGGDGGKSGISQYIIQLLRQFDGMQPANEWELYLYENERSIFTADTERILPLPISPRNRHPLLNVAWHQLSLGRWCRQRGHDVLFLPAGNRRLPLHSPCPTVGTVHDFSSLHVRGKYDWARLFYIKQVLPRLVRRLTHVLTVSESSKRDIVQYAGVPAEKVTVTHLGVDHTRFRPLPASERTEQMLEKYGIRRPYLLYVSRLEHPGKNHVPLIRAFDRLKSEEQLPHQLVLAGSDWSGSEQIHQAAAEARFADDILFTGFAPAEDLPELYCACELFVFPSQYEGFGLPVLEAMACGAPTACSDVSSLPEVAGDAALLFDPQSVDSLVETLRPALTQADVRDDFRRRGLERAARFTWERTAQTTLQVLEQAAQAV